MDRSHGFARWMVENLGVTAIPGSIFFSEQNAYIGKNIMRFAFCKKDEEIEEAGKRLGSKLALKN